MVGCGVTSGGEAAESKGEMISYAESLLATELNGRLNDPEPRIYTTHRIDLFRCNINAVVRCFAFAAMTAQKGNRFIFPTRDIYGARQFFNDPETRDAVRKSMAKDC